MRRISEALRGAGIEVWFDQNELVGGDAWDAKIRRQIAECALFVPVISASTQARREGYFRLEWRIAAQRTHMMSEQVAFLVPVVIDATRDSEADVPAEFKAVQWTRLGPGEMAAFCSRIAVLLGGEPKSAQAPAPQIRLAPARSPRPRFSRALLIAVAVASLLAAWLYYRSRPARALTDTDTIVLAEFTNTTGDPVFDGTLRQGLSAQLAQSPFLRLVSDDRIAHVLALMSQRPDARLTPELARQVCKRTASAASIEGSIASLGSEYVLGLKAVSGSDGEVLVQEQVTASHKEKVLEVLGQAATDMRAKLGESLASVKRFNALPEDVTTPSLEALQAYSLGVRAIDVANDFAAAIPFFQKAISLDPNFAMAYLGLGACYYPLSELSLGAESNARAYALREHTTEREKLDITANYELAVTGNLDAARTVTQLWSQTFPRDDDSQTNLWIIYLNLGDYERAASAAAQSLSLNPDNANDYVSVEYSEQWLNRLDRAKAAAEQAHAKNLDSPWTPVVLYVVAFLEGDSAAMERNASSPLVKPLQDLMLFLESETAAYGGQFIKSRDENRRAIDTALRAGGKEGPSEYQAHGAVREALVGNSEIAIGEAHAALARAKGKHVDSFSAIALGLAGETKEAEGLADELSRRFPEDTIVRFDYLPMIHAAIALREGKPARAIELLEACAPYESGQPNSTFTFALYPVYLRGLAYVAAGRGDAAAKEFQKIIDQRGVVGNEPIGALARLGLGRSFALSGDFVRAKAAYEQFLLLWKNADPGIGLLVQARDEYSKLR